MVTLREIKIKSVEIILYSTYGSLHLCVELLIYFIRAKVIHLYCTSFLTRLFTLTWKQTAFRVKLCFSQEMSLWPGSERIKIRQLWLQTATFFSLTTWRPGLLWLAAHSPHCPARNCNCFITWPLDGLAHSDWWHIARIVRLLQQQLPRPLVHQPVAHTSVEKQHLQHTHIQNHRIVRGNRSPKSNCKLKFVRRLSNIFKY